MPHLTVQSHLWIIKGREYRRETRKDRMIATIITVVKIARAPTPNHELNGRQSVTIVATAMVESAYIGQMITQITTREGQFHGLSPIKES